MYSLKAYREFNTKKFIQNRDKWQAEKQRLMFELANMSELPSINNESGVRSGDISDSTARMAIAREHLKNDIAEIDKMERAYRLAYATLDDAEKDAVKAICEPTKAIWKEIDEYCATHYVSTDTVYRICRNSLQKMADTIAEHFGV